MKRFNLFHITLLLIPLVAYADENPLSNKIPSDDPEKLVRAFCRADGHGMLASSEYWPLVKKYTAWEDGPGWDMGYAVESFNTIKKKQNSDTAEIEVTYNIIGRLDAARVDGGWNLDVSQGGVKRVVYHLARKNGQWEILSPQNAPHLSATYAIYFIGDQCGKYDCKDDPTLTVLRRVIQKPNYSFEPTP